MNVRELLSWRELGLAGHQVQNQGSNYWSKRNAPVKRAWTHYDQKMAKFSAPPMVSGSEALSEYSSIILPHLFEERRCELGQHNVNKIFASQWLDWERVVLGTKCNKLLVLDMSEPKFEPSNCTTAVANRKRDRQGRFLYRIEDGSVVRRPLQLHGRGRPGPSSSAPAHLTRIPNLKSSPKSSASVELRWDADESGPHSGIHAVKLNPSRSRLATGGENPSDLAVYSLPDFRPITVGEAGHSDWMFDLDWIDDEFVVSGSRDGTLALWRFEAEPNEAASCPHVQFVPYEPKLFPNGAGFGSGAFGKKRYACTEPLKTKRLPRFDRVRTLSYNSRYDSVVAASLNSCIVDVDVATLQLRRGVRALSGAGGQQGGSVAFNGGDFSEMVCMCHSGDERALAVGSRSHFTFFDASDRLQAIKDVRLPAVRPASFLFGYPGLAPSGVRSISWRGPVVTVGTGSGEVLFYDVRAHRFLQCHSDASCARERALEVGNGWMRDERPQQDELYAQGSECPTAVYTHCYDETGTRLFSAGGPIAASIQGNYAAVWQ